MTQKEIIISQGNRPFWQIILAALFFTGMVTSLYYFSTTFNIFDSEENVKFSLHFLQIAIFLFFGGTFFSSVRDYHFNFQENKYKILFCVGPIKIGRWKSFKSLEYISVFKSSSNIYEINLWYDKNKHFNISKYKQEEFALFAGKELAKKLNIDLLDATNPFSKKWVDNLKT